MLPIDFNFLQQLAFFLAGHGTRKSRFCPMSGDPVLENVEAVYVLGAVVEYFVGREKAVSLCFMCLPSLSPANGCAAPDSVAQTLDANALLINIEIDELRSYYEVVLCGKVLFCAELSWAAVIASALCLAIIII